MRILVIDDKEERHSKVKKIHQNDEIISKYTPEEACEALASVSTVSYFNKIYLDHDAEEGTFYPVACLLIAVYKEKQLMNVQLLQ